METGKAGREEQASNLSCHGFYALLSFQISLVQIRMPLGLSAVRETWVRFLGREGPLEKEMAIHSSTLVWKIPWTEEPDRLQSMGLQRVRHD